MAICWRRGLRIFAERTRCEMPASARARMTEAFVSTAEAAFAKPLITFEEWAKAFLAALDWRSWKYSSRMPRSPQRSAQKR